jgi:hypothetical protein
LWRDHNIGAPEGQKKSAIQSNAENHNQPFIIHRSGNASILPDALSQREQDLPKNLDNERLQARIFQIFENTSATEGNGGRRFVTTPIESLTNEADPVRIYATWVTGGDGNDDLDEQKAKKIIQQY